MFFMVLLAAAVIIGPISHHIGHYDSQVSEPYMSLGSSERLISGPCLRQASGLLPRVSKIDRGGRIP
ncbi:hypothetical protein IAS59_004637 [Cryptococcus gattii]